MGQANAVEHVPINDQVSKFCYFYGCAARQIKSNWTQVNFDKTLCIPMFRYTVVSIFIYGVIMLNL